MDKYIVINLNMFAENSQIFIVSPAEEKSEQIAVVAIEQIPETINRLASEYGIENIKIAGSEKYAPLIEYGIKQTEMVHYSKNNLKVEVIK